MKDTVYISGHKNPDADSICSAIAYAVYKNSTCDKTYIPIKLGEINSETKFILDYFNVEEPMMMDTIKLKVSDLEYSKLKPLKPNMTIKEAEEYLTYNNADYVAVVNDKDKLCGMITSSSLNKVFTKIWKDNVLYESKTTIDNIIRTLEAHKLYINEECQYFPGKVWIAAMSKENLTNYISEGDIVITGDIEETQKFLVNEKVSLIIVTGGSLMDDSLLEKARENGVTVISTKWDSLSAARFLFLSIPISYIMADSEVISFESDDLVKDVKNIMVKNRYRAYPIVDETGHVLGLVSRYNLLSKDKKQIILVDHNEYTQSIDGIEEAEIVEVVDHHRVGDIQSSHPIFLRNEPVGSTSTIVAKMYFEANVEMDSKIAGILMSGIISDTLLFKSPTCTIQDKEICLKLASIANIDDINKYAHDMQMVATSLEGKIVEDIFTSDFKEFKIGKIKVGIAQFNTVDVLSFEHMKKDMVKYMNDLKKQAKYDILLLALTNIMDEGSLFIAVGNTKIVEGAFNAKLVNDEVYVPGILSRKKQIVPMLTKYIEEE